MKQLRGGIAAGAALAVLATLAASGDNAIVPSVAAHGGSGQSTAAAVAARSSFRFDGQLIQGGAVVGTAPALTNRLTLDGRNVPIAPDRRFFIAFDRDAAPTATLVATRVDGSTITHPLKIQPRAWRIERLDRLPRYPQPTAEFQRRRPPELAQINAARARGSNSEGWRQTFMWPVTGRISGLFGSQRVYQGEPGSYHTGVDVARPTGTPILAPADGVVTLTAHQDFTVEGKLLLIDHGMGLNSAFLHLSRIDVKVGDVIRRGQTIGAIGTTGRSTGPHLHWGMKWGEARIDPLLIAGPMPATVD